MDFERLCLDFGIDYQTHGKWSTAGWLNIPCPFCSGKFGYHLGFNIIDGFFRCWKCGYKRVPDVLQALGLPEPYAIIKEYGGRSRMPKKSVVKVKSLILPSHTSNLVPRHKKYLESRGFDADKLQALWGLKSTGPMSKLDESWYRNRILIPIYWNGKMVSFQTRAVGKDPIKYKACGKQREQVNHQNILYGYQEFWQQERVGICVEGVTDVWKLGCYAFAVFGIEFTNNQVNQMRNQFDRVAILFDDDRQAFKQGKKLLSELRFRGCIAKQYSIKGDPGQMSRKEAGVLARQIIEDIS